MKFTRRGLARMVTISAALPVAVSAQDATGGSASFDATAKPGSSAQSDPALNAAGDEFRAAARALASVKLPRSAEPATRFEA
jgi:hypothetical protein